jgi:hypothetical protein
MGRRHMHTCKLLLTCLSCWSVVAHAQVQDAILHNKRIFEQRMLQQDRALWRKVLGGWRAVRYGSVAKQAQLRRAAARIARGALARAFFAWKDELHLVDRNLAMKRKVRQQCW